MKDKKFIFSTIKESETQKVGELLSSMVRGVILLDGDLGSGKTVLARGIARGLKISQHITSPTFNIINVYEEGDVVFNHMDAYRITDTEMLYDIGFWEMTESGDITVIEWANMIESAIDNYVVKIDIQSKDDNKRIIMIEAEEKTVSEFIRRWQ